MAKHLHQQAGGDPSQGPKGEMANPQPSPGAGNDFPDVPDANAAGGDPDAAPEGDHADDGDRVDDDMDIGGDGRSK